MINNGKSAVEEGFPVSESGAVWFFGSNLTKYLDGFFKLVFLLNNPAEELKADSMGSIKFQTKDGVDTLFTISNVRHDRFKQLDQLFQGEIKCGLHKGLEELAECKTGCHTAGHYECWRDDCDCICHIVRRFLGRALPKSYIPISR